jgi:hypothetical protein
MPSNIGKRDTVLLRAVRVCICGFYEGKDGEQGGKGEKGEKGEKEGKGENGEKGEKREKREKRGGEQGWNRPARGVKL